MGRRVRFQFDETRDSNQVVRAAGNEAYDLELIEPVSRVLFGNRPDWLDELWANDEHVGPRMSLPQSLVAFIQELRTNGASHAQRREQFVVSLLTGRVPRNTFKTTPKLGCRSCVNRRSAYHYEHAAAALRNARDKLVAGTFLGLLGQGQFDDAVKLLVTFTAANLPQKEDDSCRWSTGPAYRLSRATQFLSRLANARQVYTYQEVSSVMEYIRSLTAQTTMRSSATSSVDHVARTRAFIFDYLHGIIESAYDPANAAEHAEQIIAQPDDYLSYRRAMRTAELGPRNNSGAQWRCDLDEQFSSPAAVEPLRYATYYSAFTIDRLSPHLAGAIESGDVAAMVRALEHVAKSGQTRMIVSTDVQIHTRERRGRDYEDVIGFMKPALVLRVMDACGIDAGLSAGQWLAFLNQARCAARAGASGAANDAVRWVVNRASQEVGRR